MTTLTQQLSRQRNVSVLPAAALFPSSFLSVIWAAFPKSCIFRRAKNHFNVVQGNVNASGMPCILSLGSALWRWTCRMLYWPFNFVHITSWSTLPRQRLLCHGNSPAKEMWVFLSEIRIALLGLVYRREAWLVSLSCPLVSLSCPLLSGLISRLK